MQIRWSELLRANILKAQRAMKCDGEGIWKHHFG